MDLDKAIKERRSIRKFSKKKPDWRKIIESIDAARYAPMAGNNYTLNFIVVSNQESIKKISEACQQDFIAKAFYVVVVCSDPKRLENAYGERGKIYSKQQAGAAMENFWLKLVDLELSSCWVGYFVEEQIKKILKIPEKIDVEAVFPIGFEYSQTPMVRRKSKIELDNILFFDEYGQETMN